MAYRKERLEKIILREVTNILLGESRDYRLSFVTITRVDLIKDLSVATIFYTVSGTDMEVSATGKAFQEALSFIR
jgi:ribosome-binding factor A